MSRLGSIEQTLLPCDKQDQLINIISFLTEMHCDFNSKIKFNRIKFHKHSLEMFRKS